MKNIIKKIGVSLVTIWVIVTLTFFLMKVLPGDPFSDEQALPESIHKSLRAHYGLDDPLWKQYVSYLGSVLKGDFGPSFKHQDRTVNGMIRQGAPISLLLGGEALLLALFVGIPLGTISALYHHRWQDKMAMLVVCVGISIPSFLLATLLQWGLATKLSLFPIARWGSFSQTILPSVALAMLPIAFIARLIRASLLEVLKQDYIQLAFAKGLPKWRVVLFHGLGNALLPLLPYFGQLAAGILTGSFIVEKIFAIPGLGQAFVTSVSSRDYTVIMGLTIFYSVILLGCVVTTDTLYACLDPRVLKKGTYMRFGAILLIVIGLLALFGPLCSPYTYFDIALAGKNQPPSWIHWFGTDDLGRDLWTRVWYGARISLSVGVIAALVDLALGVLWGGIAAFVGGKWDEIMMRIADVLYALPYLLVVTLLIVIMGPGLLTIILAMSIIGWITMARIVRGQILTLKEQEYVLASKALGASFGRILTRHLLPNAAGPIIVTLTLTIRSAIFVEAFLSFLGLGVQAPVASWGTMASEGLTAMQFYPWRLFFPGLMISLTILAFQLVGDGLRDTFTVEEAI